MSLSREQYVAICETCIKRKTMMKVGLVCSLTDAQATFDSTCPDYEKDQLEANRIERIKQYDSDSTGNNAPFSGEKSMFSAGIAGGIALIACGLIWIFAGIAGDRIFFYPFFLIVAGIVAVMKGIAKKAKELKKPDTSNILDDKNDLEVL